MKTAHYPGDRRNFDPDSYVGFDGRFFRPVDAVFDGERTTISYEPVPMEEMPQRYGHKIDEVQEKHRILQVFGGRW